MMNSMSVITFSGDKISTSIFTLNALRYDKSLTSTFKTFTLGS